MPQQDPFANANLFQDLKQATQSMPQPKQQQSDGDLEKNLMGMFENLAKQLEDLDGDDDGEIDDKAIEDAEKMMKGLFGGLMGGG